MHELSIAQSIVTLAEQQAREHNATIVEEIVLEIGRLAGVELQTLKFAMESAVKETCLENASIVWCYMDGEGVCTDCETTFPVETLFSPCPHCESYCVKIVKGRELRIQSLVIK